MEEFKESDMAAIDRLVERFLAPLETAQADTDAIKPEFCDMVDYAVQCIALSSIDYQSVWWRQSKLCLVGKCSCSRQASFLSSSIKWKARMYGFHTWHNQG